MKPKLDGDIEPIREEDMTKRQLVACVNGDLGLLRGARLVWRQPVKFRGEWCVRDHGRVPLIGRIGDIYVT
jgi:hypothetical protein